MEKTRKELEQFKMKEKQEEVRTGKEEKELSHLKAEQKRAAEVGKDVEAWQGKGKDKSEFGDMALADRGQERESEVF